MTRHSGLESTTRTSSVPNTNPFTKGKDVKMFRFFGLWKNNGDLQADEELRQRLSRKCGATATAYRNCLRANTSGGEESCRNLKRQLAYCQGMILCEKQAAEYGQCIERTVRERKRYDECNDVFRRMERCLSSRQNKRFLQSQDR